MITLGTYDYNPGDVLGSGAFAIVYKGQFKDSPEKKVAIKRMLKDHNIIKSKTLLSKEIAVLKEIAHENIVLLYDYSISSTGVYLVMEYCNGGDLSDYLHRLKTLSEDTIQNFLVQIGSAMDAMNRKGIMHRDLKPGNILLNYPSRGRFRSILDVPGTKIVFKLADFGFARFLQDGMMAVTMCGSPMYMAPEVLMCWKYDALADIWSMGIIVYQCLTGKAPFYANTPEALKNIYAKTPTLRPKIPSTTSPLLKDLLLLMLVRNPKDRIDFKRFLAHPFMQRKDASYKTEPVQIKRRNSSGADIRLISNSPQSNHLYPATAPGKPDQFSDGLNDIGTSPGRRAVPEDDGNDDYVILNSDGSEVTGNAADSDPARKLFDLSSGSTDVSANLLDTCNTSANFRRGLAAAAQATTTRSRDSPTRPRPPSYPQQSSPYPRVLKQSDQGDIERSPSKSPQRTKFFVGSSGGTGTGATSPALSNTPCGSPNVVRTTAHLRDPPAGALSNAAVSDLNLANQRESDVQGPSRNFRLFGDQRSHTAPGDINNAENTGRPSSDVLQGNGYNHRSSSPRNVLHPDLLNDAPDLVDEVVMDASHVEEVNKITMVLELCELLTELAEHRSTPFSESTIGARNESNAQLKFATEAQRIVEQVVLYKRVLQYLEFVFFRVKHAFQEGKLKATQTARTRLKECNSIYHRCYIRLRHLARESQTENLMDDVLQLKKLVTANKLIFQYALDQCSAAEMDDFVGEIDMCLRRYKAAMTLLHGLGQHAQTPPDRDQLSHYLGLIQDRYARLWNSTLPTDESQTYTP